MTLRLDFEPAIRLKRPVNASDSAAGRGRPAEAAFSDIEAEPDLLPWPLALLFIATGSVSVWTGLWAAGAWLFAF